MIKKHAANSNLSKSVKSKAFLVYLYALEHTLCHSNYFIGDNIIFEAERKAAFDEAK